MKFFSGCILLASLLLTIESQAKTNYSYSEMLNKLKSCRTSLEGCTMEEELDLAKFSGLVLAPNDLESYLAKDTQRSIFIPLALHNNELLALAAATSLGVIAFNNDQEITDLVERNQTTTKGKISTVGNFLGSGTSALGIAAGSYFLGVTYKDNKLKQVGVFIVGASVSTLIISEGVKRTFGRAGPNDEKGPYNFFNSKSAFYTGQTAEAFTIATVISELYKNDQPIVPWVAYGVATITAYSRVHSKERWASDVIAGAISGHLLTKLAMNFLSGNKERRGGVDIFPGLTENGTPGVYVQWTPKTIDAPLRCSKMMTGTLKINACIDEAFEEMLKK